MSVIMPCFLKEENQKWIIENKTPDGGTYYVAKANAPEEIKKEVKRWNKMFERAESNNREL